MPSGSSELNRQYQHTWYLKNKERRAKDTKEAKRLKLKWFEDYKRTLKCVLCGESDFRCLDFNHRDRSEKDMDVGKTVNIGWSIAHILKEIAKCDVLCSNCHRKLHYKEKYIQ